MPVLDRSVTDYDGYESYTIQYVPGIEVAVQYDVVLEDTFTETSDAWLENHTPEVGGPWTWNTDDDWTAVGAYHLNIDAATDRVGLASSFTSAACYIPILSQADVDIIMTFYVGGNQGGQEISVYFRSPSLTTRDGYCVRVSSGKINIYSVTLGVDSAIWTGGSQLGDTPAEYQCRVQMIGASLTFWEVDILDTDTPVLQTTDTDYSALGYVAVRGDAGSNLNTLSYLKVAEI